MSLSLNGRDYHFSTVTFSAGMIEYYVKLIEEVHEVGKELARMDDDCEVGVEDLASELFDVMQTAASFLHCWFSPEEIDMAQERHLKKLKKRGKY